MLGPCNRSAIVTVVAVCVLVTFWLNLGRLQQTPLTSKIGTVSLQPSTSIATEGHLPAPVALYFDQVFAEQPEVYDFPGLREHCDRTEWISDREDVYIHCGNMFAGMTSIMSEMKVCLKMAVEAGTGIVLPTIPLRDSTDLKEFNVDHPEAFFPYNQWFDEKHLRDGLARACPHMKVLNPDSLDKDQADRIMVKNNWEMDVTKAPGYHFFASHFWVGNPFSTFFDDEFKRLQRESDSGSGEGITVIKIACIFLLFRITDDPTGGDLLLWNDLAMLMRFLEKPRKIVHNLLAQLNRPFYGVHFRVENDTVWGSLESQLSLDLDALDKAWSMYKHDNGLGSQKPIVYVACGDEGQMKAFIEGGKFRGWDVTHKWDLARQISNPETVKMIDGLAFDFQGAVDMGMMIQSHFFIGISGSAMSNTIAHARDVTGRYRGSSLREKIDDGGARSYLVHDGQASSYPCCL